MISPCDKTVKLILTVKNVTKQKKIVGHHPFLTWYKVFQRFITNSTLDYTSVDICHDGLMQETSGDIWTTCLPACVWPAAPPMALTRLAQLGLKLSVTEPDYIKAITTKGQLDVRREPVHPTPTLWGGEGRACGWGNMEASCLTYVIWTLTGFCLIYFNSYDCFTELPLKLTLLAKKKTCSLSINNFNLLFQVQ